MTSPGGWEEELQQRLHGIFLAEAAERLDALDAAVGAVAGGLPAGAAEGPLADAFRHAHTVKGGARAVGLPDVERLAETLEALLERVRDGAPAGPATWEAVAAGVGTLRRRLAGEPVDVDAAVATLSALPGPAG